MNQSDSRSPVMFTIAKPDVAEGDGSAVGLEDCGAGAEHPVNKNTVAAVVAIFPQVMTKVYRSVFRGQPLDQFCQWRFANEKFEYAQRDCNRNHECDDRRDQSR